MKNGCGIVMDKEILAELRAIRKEQEKQAIAILSASITIANPRGAAERNLDLATTMIESQREDNFPA